jgi:predicted RNase H-like HicB family nuclease
MSRYTAIVKEADGWWIGWVGEVPGVNGQERTRERLIEHLREALMDGLEFNRADARAAAGREWEELEITFQQPPEGGRQIDSGER